MALATPTAKKTLGAPREFVVEKLCLRYGILVVTFWCRFDLYNGKIIAGQIRLLSAIKGKEEKAGTALVRPPASSNQHTFRRSTVIAPRHIAADSWFTCHLSRLPPTPRSAEKSRPVPLAEIPLCRLQIHCRPQAPPGIWQLQQAASNSERARVLERAVSARCVPRHIVERLLMRSRMYTEV